MRPAPAGAAPLPTGPHRRFDPLAGSWVLVSPGRDRRPWRGQVEAAPPDVRPEYDATCPLCPDNVRASGVRNPRYEDTFVFPNDFPALRPDGERPAGDESASAGAAGPDLGADGAAPRPGPGADGAAGRGPGAGGSAPRPPEALFVTEPEAGEARVLCFSPRHDRSLGSLPEAAIRGVVDLWAAQTAELRERWRWVQVFENRGPEMGASNPHPHGQLWAGSALPSLAAREDDAQRAWFGRTGRPLLLDVVEREWDGPRVVEAGDGWLALVPYWAAWPYELLLVPRRPVATLDALDGAARDALAGLLGRLLRRLDGLMGRPFPYSMGWHQAPGLAAAEPHWQLHAHLFPPLLRAEARKWMVGYELLAEPQRDFTPEDAAERLRAATPVAPPRP